MKMIKYSAALLCLLASSVNAASYVVDDNDKGAHAAINFKIQHLGYSWLSGRFNNFEGQFNYDEGKLKESSVKITIDTKSVDSNHAERDKHLRSDDFLDVDDYPKATFISTQIEPVDNQKFNIHGKLTLHGVTKNITINAEKIGEGKDPWGGYRAGFSGTTQFKLKDFGITRNLGPASETIYLDLHVEGIRQ